MLKLVLGMQRDNADTVSKSFCEKSKHEMFTIQHNTKAMIFLRFVDLLAFLYRCICARVI